MRLAGKTAIVTGGGSGFGAGIARKFIAEGAQVVIADSMVAYWRYCVGHVAARRDEPAADRLHVADDYG